MAVHLVYTVEQRGALRRSLKTGSLRKGVAQQPCHHIPSHSAFVAHKGLWKATVGGPARRQVWASPSGRGAERRGPGVAHGPLYNYKMIVAYDGTDYKGFQLQLGQKRMPTIQAALEKALTKFLQEPREDLKLQASGRTDSGVHANGQVVNFYSAALLEDPALVARRLNAMMPQDIRVLSCKRVPVDFSSRMSSLSKIYQYHVCTQPILHPMQLRFRGHVPFCDNMDALREAAQQLLGKHDFAGFSSKPGDGVVGSTWKTLHRCDVVNTDDGFMLEVEGDGFLYRMVRHLAGALIAVGKGSITVKHVQLVLQEGQAFLDSRPGGHRGWKAAVAKGLVLHEVVFPPHDDVESLMCPELPHDERGRLCVGACTPGDDD